MSKVLAFVLVMVLAAALGYGGFVLFNRYGNAPRQIERMVRTMSEMKTAQVSGVLKRSPREANRPFLFGDIRFEGSLDVRAPEQPAYDLRFDVSAVAGASEERALVLARLLRRNTSVQIAEAPDALADMLQASGIELGKWNRVKGTEDVLALFGEQMRWTLLTSENIAALRVLVSSQRWGLDPKATLTEIVHGRVTRIFTAELDPESFLALEREWQRLREGREATPDEEARIEARRTWWEDARVNLWIDQRTDELRRLVVQLSNGDFLDVEFEEINGEMVIEEPENDRLPLSEDSSETPEDETRNSPPERFRSERAGGSSNTRNANLGSNQIFPSVGDSDGDGLTDDLEGFYGSNSNNSDTDGDGYLDGAEVKNGYSPTGNGTLFNFGLPTL